MRDDRDSPSLNDVRVGCSGWNYKHWREAFYPKGLPASRWLEHYASAFDTVEVNSTFYRLARPVAVARWLEQTPPDFLFAVKASRYLTHVKRLQDLAGGVARFYESIRPLVDSPKLGPVLWQLPPTFHRDDDRLAAALEAIPPGRHCFEFRDESWFADDVYAILREHGAALVVGDDPRRPFQTRELTTDWTFVRFHSGRAGDGNYGPNEIASWARQIREWRLSVDVYAYFNNDWHAYAIANAQALKAALERPRRASARRELTGSPSR